MGSAGLVPESIDFAKGERQWASQAEGRHGPRACARLTAPHRHLITGLLAPTGSLKCSNLQHTPTHTGGRGGLMAAEATPTPLLGARALLTIVQGMSMSGQ